MKGLFISLGAIMALVILNLVGGFIHEKEIVTKDTVINSLNETIWQQERSILAYENKVVELVGEINSLNSLLEEVTAKSELGSSP